MTGGTRTSERIKDEARRGTPQLYDLAEEFQRFDGLETMLRADYGGEFVDP